MIVNIIYEAVPILSQYNTFVKFFWVPSHTPGNLRADKVVKEACDMPSFRKYVARIGVCGACVKQEIADIGVCNYWQ